MKRKLLAFSVALAMTGSVGMNTAMATEYETVKTPIGATALATLQACSPSTDSGIALKDATLVGDEIINTSIGTVEIQHNYVTDESAQALYDEMDYQRATQLYIWSTPFVSYHQWERGQNGSYGGEGRNEWVVYESLNEKRSIVTANVTTPYIISWADLSEEPMYLEVPAGPTAGMFMDGWQKPVADIGLTGPDQGKGGKYIIVGPEDDASKYEQEGVFVFQSETNSIFYGVRILNNDPSFIKSFKENLRIGANAEDAKSSIFIEGKDIEFSATAPRGLEYWKLLSDSINRNPVREIDKGFMAMLKPLGIEKGKAFNPTDRQKDILLEGAAMGELQLRNMQTNPRFAEPYWSGTSWYKSFDFGIEQQTDNLLEMDERAVWFYEAVTSSKGMVTPTLGKGSVYMTSKRDSEGQLLRADKNYKLTVPANAPVGQFWALTLYSEDTRRPYDNGSPEIKSVNLDSLQKQLQYNEDGSVDLYIGPDAPEGMESNWMKTVGTDGWFTYFRLYAPLQPWFNKTWSLSDFERLD